MRNLLGPAIAGMLAFALYLPWTIPGEIMTRSDNFWYVPTAMSLLAEGNIELSEFRPELEALIPDNPFLTEYLDAETDYRIYELSSGGLVNHYTIGNALAAVPLLPILNWRYRNVENRIWRSMLITPLLAKIYAAASVALFFIVARCLTRKTWQVVALTVLFALASPNVASHAGGYWSHNTGTFFLLATLALLLSGEGRWAWTAAFPLAFATVVRPDMIVATAAFTLYLFFQHRKQFIAFAISGGSIAILYVVHCLMTYGHLIQPYQGPVDEVGTSVLGTFKGLAGLLISPNRGLLVFTPVFVFSLLACVKIWRGKKNRRVLRYLSVIVLVHLLFNALWPVWWAGWSYGPRLFAGIAPLWVLLLLPILEQGKRAIFVALACAGLFSAFVQYRGLSSRAVHDWNATPVSVNEDPARLWGWSDLQMFRGLF
ncbi:MAG: hypothetical protein ACI9QL_001305 [Candidatus Omnitrophota bacterium]